MKVQIEKTRKKREIMEEGESVGEKRGRERGEYNRANFCT